MIKADDHNWDPESKLFLQHKNLVEKTDQNNGSIFCTLAECPDCNPLWNPYCGGETLLTTKLSPKIPKEIPDVAKYIRSEGGGSNTIVVANGNSGTSLNPLMSVGCEMEESIHSDSSTLEIRNRVCPFRNGPKKGPASDSTILLCSTQSGIYCTPKHDCNLYCQSNSSSSTQKAENIDRLDSSNYSSAQTNPGDENRHDSTNSVPTGKLTCLFKKLCLKQTQKYQH